MQVHFELQQLPGFRKAVVTIGTFDGVHLGHRQIIDRLLSEAASIDGESVIITFHPHPRKIIGTNRSAVPLLNTLQEKIALLSQLGIDHLVVVPFTDEFAHMSATNYVRDFLVARFMPHTIIIGYDHRFGQDRTGDFRLLEELAPEFDFQLREIPRQVLDEIAISSTAIRKAILEGLSDTAERLLGYPFFFSGKVVHGDKLGRQIGYPTANIDLHDPEKIVPAEGIYVVTASILNSGQQVFKQSLKGMMSIGFRPTVGGTQRKIEVNLFDFQDDLYDRELRVYLRKYLRPEIKFDSIAALIEQIDQDKLDSIEYFRKESLS